MAHHGLPLIHNNHLVLQDPTGNALRSVLVGSDEWYTWLQEEHNPSFAFKTQLGSFTARCERKRNGWYWYAYHKRGGKLHKFYLGKTAGLNLERLNSAATQLLNPSSEAIVLTKPHEELPETKTAFPSPPSLPSTSSPEYRQPTPHYFPPQLTPVVGREQEIAEVHSLLHKTRARLITLTGTGGIGKTSLAIRIATTLQDDFIDGIYFVSLASINDPLLVIPTIVQTLGIQENENQSSLDTLKKALQEKHMLLLLDNFEQVIMAAPHLPDLLSACPHMILLVTSRTILRVHGEYDFPVPPLALPDLARLPDCEALAQYASIALFLQRAKAIKPDFQLTQKNAPILAEICVHLDGLPLAIELATARMKLLPPQELLARLTRRLQILTRGARDAPLRQQTLRNTIEWSYHLLNAEEQQLFQRLSVFTGGCTLKSLVAVCNSLDGQSTEIAILNGASSLIDKSLLSMVELDGYEPRLKLLETLREYASETLSTSEQFALTRRMHAYHYLSFVEEIEPGLLGSEQVTCLERLEQEHDNIRTALQWALEQGDDQERTAIALRMCGALPRFWDMRGHRGEGWNFLLRALAVHNETTAPLRVKALDAAALLAINQSDHDLAIQMSEENLALCRKLGDIKGIAFSLHRLGGIAWAQANYAIAQVFEEEAVQHFRALHDDWSVASSLEVLTSIAIDQGAYDRAHVLVDECLLLWRKVGNKWGIAYALWLSGSIFLYSQEDLAKAHSILEESLAISRSVGHKASVGYALINLGFATFFQGDFIGTRPLFEEGMSIFQTVRDRRGIALSHYAMGWLAFSQGEYAKARSLFEEGLNTLNALGHRWIMTLCLESLAGIHALEGQPAKAILLWGAAENLRDIMGAPILPITRVFYEQMVEHARTQINEHDFSALWKKGQSMPLQLVLATQQATTLPTSETSSTPKPAATSYPDQLTNREVQVLRLVTQGWTDLQIAAHLVISHRTVNTHITSIYRKALVSSRSGATRYAIQHHLI
jgi:predicted ATPase/DNA-binding CsgD family transcriptional regulator/tetratricopeptide (TPR) repeat protein